MVDVKSAWVSFPGLNGFEVEIAYISRPELQKLRKTCMVTKFVKRSPVTDLDEDKYVDKFTSKTVLAWKGLNLENLEKLMPVKVPDDFKELEHSSENAAILVKNSSEFDDWLTEAVFDLENFRGERETKPVEKTGNVAK